MFISKLTYLLLGLDFSVNFNMMILVDIVPILLE